MTKHRAPAQGAVTLLLLLSGVLLWARPCGAAPPEEARALLHQGNQLFQHGDYKEALDKFLRARNLHPSYKIDFNIGATYHAMKRPVEAASYLSRFLLRAGTVARKDQVRRANELLAELERDLAVLQLTCDVQGAVVGVGRRIVGLTPLDVPIYTEPGRARLTVSKAGHTLYTKDLELSAGKRRAMTVHLRSNPTGPGLDPEVPPYLDEGAGSEKIEDDAGSGRLDLPDRKAERSRLQRSILGYSTLGVGVACLVTATLLYGLGASEGGEAYDSYLGAREPDEILAHWQDVEAAREKLVAGHVLAAVAVVSLGTAIYFFSTMPPSRQEAGRFTAVTLGLMPQGATLRLDVRY